jgi:hypothetical protein
VITSDAKLTGASSEGQRSSFKYDELDWTMPYMLILVKPTDMMPWKGHTRCGMLKVRFRQRIPQQASPPP